MKDQLGGGMDGRPPAPPTGVPAVDDLAPPRSRGARRRKRSGPLRRTWRRLRRPLLWTALAGGVLLLLLGIDVGARYAPAARALAHGRDASLEAEALLSTDTAHLDRARLQRASTLLAEANLDFGPRSAIVQDGLTGGLLARLPWLGRQVTAARALRDAGAAGSSLGLDLMPLLDQVVPDPARPSLPTLARITRGAREQQGTLTAATRHLEDLGAAVRNLPAGGLVGPLDSARQTVLRAAPRVEGGVGPVITLLRAAPAAVGDGTHTYLLLFENPTEQRPAGGFIGSVGEATFTDGALTSATFQDPGALNPGIRSVPVPSALDRHLYNGHPLEFGDVNWDADFPTAAAETARLYTLATHHHTDGVISLDPIALGYVLAVRGPVRVPPYPQTITAGNALAELNYIANEVRPGDPGRVFLPPFGRAMLDSIVRTPPSQLAALSEALRRGAREKHIVLNFNDPALQRLVDQAGLGGRISTPAGDTVLVDDANLSGTKGDWTVTRDYTLTAGVDPSGEVHDHLVLSYRNPVPTDPFKARLEVSSGGAYRDYLRVYVPQTARLDGMSLALNGHPAERVLPEEVVWEHGQEAIATWIVVPRAGTAQLTLDYSGPFADASRGPVRYTIDWAKQVDALTWPIRLTADLPGTHLAASTNLEADRRWELVAR